MEKNNPFPITEENFAQCWEYIDKRHRAVRRKSVIAKIGGFVIVQFFLLFLVGLVCGLLRERLGGSFGAFVETTFFFPLWEQIAAGLLTPGASLWEDIGKLLLLDYVLSAIAFVFLTALIWLLYHPLKEKLPTGTYAENTARLAKKAQEGRDCCYKTRLSTSIVASVIAVIAVFVVLFAYAVYVQDAALITALLTTFPTKDPQTNALIYVIILYKFFDIVCSVLLFFTRPLYRYEFPYELVELTRRSVIFARESGEDLSPGDLEVKYKEKAVAIREEAIELEKINAHEKARDLYLDAAVLSDVPAMEHYARLCLLSRMNDSARYWLKKCVATEEASPKAKKMLLRMRLGLRHNVEYLKPEQAPPTTAMKIKRALQMTFTVIWRIFVVGLLAASILVCVLLYKSSTDPEAYEALPTTISQALADLKSKLSSGFGSPAEEVSPFETPVLSLTEEGTKWENGCVAYDENGAPVVFCYGKDIGGEIKAPYPIGTEGKVRSATLYTGKPWNMPSLIKHVTYLPQTQTVVIAEEYLKSLEPGEYFIILDKTNYIPLLVNEQTTFNSTQRGLAARGNENSWIVNDLDNPQDITLSFYNLGDNPIRSLSEMRQQAQTAPVDAQYYTISSDGYSVTLHQEYLSQQQVGAYVGFQVQLANGDTLDTGNVYVGTAQGEFTGLLEIAAEETYSLSRGKDYVAQYQFGLPGTLTSLHVGADSYPDIIVDSDLSDGKCDYIDFDSGTITLPMDELKPCLTVKEYFHITIGYTTAHGQEAYLTFSVKVNW